MFQRLIIKNFFFHLKQYQVTLTCCLLSVAMLFAYSTIYTNKSVIEALSNPHLVTLLKVSNIVLLVYSFLFISYTMNHYFTNKKKEYAILNMLGCPRYVMVKNLLAENAVILGISLIFGITIGVVLSYGFMFIFKFLLDYQDIRIEMHIVNVFGTMIFFTILFVLQVLLGLFRFHQISPLVLVQKTFKRVNKSYFILWLLGFLALIQAFIYYYDKTLNPQRVKANENPLLFFACLLGVGIVLFTYHLDSILAWIPSFSKKYYYKKIVAISLLQINFKESRKLILTLTLVTFLIITLVSTVLSTYLNAVDTTKRTQPFDLVVSSVETPNGENRDLDSFQEKFEELNQANDLKVKRIQYIVGIHGVTISNKQETAVVENSVIVLSESSYSIISNEHVSLSDSEYHMHMNDLYKNIINTFPYSHDLLRVGDHELALDFKGQKRAPLINLKFLDQNQFVVVSDKTYKKLASDHTSNAIEHTLQFFDLGNWFSTEKIVKHMKSKGLIPESLDICLATDYLRNYKQETGTRLFIVSFIGFLFLISGICLQVLKLLADREELKDVIYKLRILGHSRHQISRSIRFEYFVSLLFPYVFGCLLGYIYARINSIHSPIYHYFISDLIFFSVAFIIIQIIFFEILFGSTYKKVVNT